MTRQRVAGDCAFCPRTATILTAVGACEHCDAIFYDVWNWSGAGPVPPTRATYVEWAADRSGSVADNRLRKRYTSAWLKSDGAMVPVPARCAA